MGWRKHETGYALMIIGGGTALVLSLCHFAVQIAHGVLGW